MLDLKSIFGYPVYSNMNSIGIRVHSSCTRAPTEHFIEEFFFLMCQTKGRGSASCNIKKEEKKLIVKSFHQYRHETAEVLLSVSLWKNSFEASTPSKNFIFF